MPKESAKVEWAPSSPRIDLRSGSTSMHSTKLSSSEDLEPHWREVQGYAVAAWELILESSLSGTRDKCQWRVPTRSLDWGLGSKGVCWFLRGWVAIRFSLVVALPLQNWGTSMSFPLKGSWRAAYSFNFYSTYSSTASSLPSADTLPRVFLAWLIT